MPILAPKPRPRTKRCHLSKGRLVIAYETPHRPPHSAHQSLKLSFLLCGHKPRACENPAANAGPLIPTLKQMTSNVVSTNKTPYCRQPMAKGLWSPSTH